MRKMLILISLAMTLSANSAWSTESTENGVTRFVERAMMTVKTASISTPAAGRLYAMTTVAMYDAVNGIDVQSAQAGKERAFVIVPPHGAPSGANRNVAAAAAAAAVLKALAPSQSAAIDAALASEVVLAGGNPNRPRIQNALQWGQLVGAEVVAARAVDGTQAPLVISGDPATAGKYPVNWSGAQFKDMAPFGVEAIADFVDPNGPPALDGRRYALDLYEVQLFGTPDGDAEGSAIGTFWFFPGGSVTETGAWLNAALEIARQRGTVQSVSETARLFALLGMSVADAVTVAWTEKALHFTWRPLAAIRRASEDGNDFTTENAAFVTRFGETGTSPEWISGLSSFSGAATKAIEQFYCENDIAFSFSPDPIKPARSFASLSEGANEAALSRILQGVHFRFSNEAALRVGRKIAEDIAAHRMVRTNAESTALRAICPQL
jgi:hypothetical protein